LISYSKNKSLLIDGKVFRGKAGCLEHENCSKAESPVMNASSRSSPSSADYPKLRVNHPHYSWS